MRRFWELECVPTELPMSEDERICEEFFLEIHSQESSGRYIVRLSLKKIQVFLGIHTARLLSVLDYS